MDIALPFMAFVALCYFFANIYDLLLTLILPFADIITFYGPL